MDNKRFTYDAFISYRHTELDKFVAENLHKYMESFKLPKSIVKRGNLKRNKIERIFRDKEELPLTNNLEDPIMQALYESEYLIVICSPRLKESMWCKREIETFIQYHGQENILAVLVEGEPQDSFPEELMYVDEVFYYDDGTQGVNRRPVEPLAADVRGKNKREILKNIKSEMLRCLAPMFGVGYDDLKQRHRERRMKKIVSASVAAAALCLMIGVASTLAALHINRQKEQIEKQSVEIQRQADEIIEQSAQIQEQYDQLLMNQAENLAADSLRLLDEGDRTGAIETAVQALTSYEGIDMPYTADAKYALTESLYAYDLGKVERAQYQIEVPGIIDDFFVSPDRNYIVISDDTASISVWDVETRQVLDTVSIADGSVIKQNQFGFIDSDRFAFVSDSDEISIYQISSKQVTDIITLDSVTGIYVDSKGKYMAVNAWNNMLIYDLATLQQLYSYPLTEGYLFDNDCGFSEADVFIYAENISLIDENAEDKAKSLIKFVDLATGEIYADLPVEYDAVEKVVFDGDIVYILANNLFTSGISSDGAVLAYNTADAASLWEQVYQGDFLSEIELPRVEDSDRIVVGSSYNLYALNKKTGAEEGRNSAGASIIAIGASSSADLYMVFTSDGEFCSFNPSNGEMFIMDYIFECKADRVKTIKGCADGYLVLPYRDNRITVYNVCSNPDRVLYEGDIPDEEEKEITDYVQAASDMGLEKATLVSYILYSDDGKVMFVSYSDSTVEVYNADTMDLLEAFDCSDAYVDQYLGADEEGNMYIAGDSEGFCLDSNYQLIAVIDQLVYMDRDKNILVLDGMNDGLYQVPIYTTEALIKMAEEVKK